MDKTTFTGACILLVTCLLPVSEGQAKIIYVDGDAGGLNDGSSWANAYQYLQDALADANDSEKPVEIRVAQGTYKPDQGAGRKTGDVEATFRLISGVTVRGSYAGCAGVDPDARDMDRYESVLSGDLGDDDPDVNEPWDHIYRPGRNSITVVTGSGTDASAVLDGFTVRGGYYPISGDRIDPSHPPPPTGSGGGMNNLGGSPTVIGCTFIGNMSFGAGGGMCNEGGSHPAVIDCAFIRNDAHFGGGGAIANSGNSNPTFTRCTFTENSAWNQGGGVYDRKSGPTFDECAFIRNSTESKYGSRGGAVYDEESTCTWTDCIFVENDTSASGGAICSLDSNSLFLERCTFAGNSAGTGGAISGSVRNNDMTITACTFRQNLARGDGGALYLWGPAQVSNCIFSGNTSRLFGGAAAVRGGMFTNCLFCGNRAFDGYVGPEGVLVPNAGAGGAVSQSGSTEALHFTNCTFAENRAGYGSAVYTDYTAGFDSCILRGPTPLIHHDPYELQPQVAYCDIEYGWPGAGNIDTDPCFAEPGHWMDANDPNVSGDPNDRNTVWIDGDYRLRSQGGRWNAIDKEWVQDDVTSLCIDAGDPNSPVGDEPPPNGGRINMGAYGGTAEASKSP